MSASKIKADQDVILLVEDEENDIVLVQKAFKKGGLLNPIHVVRDGEQAIYYLEGRGAFSNRDEHPLPSLILLDLKMPRKDGFQVLEWLSCQPELRRIRVVVLTSSDQIKDVNRAYALGANSFLVKPIGMQDFISLVVAINGYWLWMSRAPEVEQPGQQATNPR
jgi:CheY-like chemotaxis protein